MHTALPKVPTGATAPPPLFVSAIYCVGNGWWFLVVFVKSHLVTVTSVFVAL